MKTIVPIKIEATQKSSLIESAKRAINNANINCSIVNLIVGAVECLVYPNDNLTKVLHYVKLQSILVCIQELEGKA